MNPYDALRLHWEWRIQLRLFVSGHGGPFDTSTVGRDDACDLGIWIRGEGARHAAMPSLAHLESAHAAFHEAAAEIVKRVNDGDRDGARALIEPGTRFDHASNATVLAILRLASDLATV
jgi:hypothetical protein